MPKQLHERLRDLRLAGGFRTKKHFLAYAARRYGAQDEKAYREIAERRYGRIERGELLPRVDEVIAICWLLSVPTDALLIDHSDTVVVGGLGDQGRKALLRIADEIRKLEQ